ncbi:MAG: phenylalanine--tRNA ligase subunit beta [Saprospiraceae bacterium]
MRISYNWLKTLIDLDKSPEELADILTSLGLEVEAMENIESIQGGLKGVVVGEVLECLPHPNADRLKLTKVFLGSGDAEQIVCGATNVAVGQKVFVATIGSSLYPKNGDPIIIKKSKIRGEESNGMICAEDELGLSDLHDGIMVLDPEAKPGQPASEYLKLQSDVVFEIGLTPNRADATSHLGVARDLAAWFMVHEKVKKEIKLQDKKYDFKKAINPIPFEVKIVREDLCPRYTGVCISNLRVEPSPEWLQRCLVTMDQKPINNIVDITNFVLFQFGQPLHAFDLDKIKNKKIIVNTLSQSTKFICLDGQEKSLQSEDLMICDAEEKPLCMAGIMGGIESGVSAETQSIFLESAYFNASSIRKSSMHHILRTNAAKIFEKGADPNINIQALQAAVELIIEIAGGEISSEWIDHYPVVIEPAVIPLKLDYVNSLSGMEFDDHSLKEVLLGLGMEIIDGRDESYTVFVGTNKPDVLRPADVVEEICRVYGLDHIPIPEKIQISFPNDIDSLHSFRKKLSDFLSSKGFNEILNLSLCSSELCLKTAIWKAENLVYINNTSNSNLDILVPSLSIGGLQTIQFNTNRQQADLCCYEFGKEYLLDGEEYLENQKLGIFLTGNKNLADWKNSKLLSYDFFDIKKTVEEILQYFGIPEIKKNVEEQVTVFEYVSHLFSGKKKLVSFGELRPQLTKVFDLKRPVFYAEFDLKNLQAVWKEQKITYKELSRFPSSRRDLALIVSEEVKYSEIETEVYQTASKNLKEVALFDIYRNEDQVGINKKSLALSLLFESMEKSLSNQELDLEIEKIITRLETKVQAKIRR